MSLKSKLKDWHVKLEYGVQRMVTNDIDPQKWLSFVINNINDTQTSKVKDLLPQFIDKKLLE